MITVKTLDIVSFHDADLVKLALRCGPLIPRIFVLCFQWDYKVEGPASRTDLECVATAIVYTFLMSKIVASCAMGDLHEVC